MLNFLLENFRMGLKNLRLHKLRSLLTALGIIFGVMAVIAMVAIGEGGKQAALDQMQQLGARNIVLRSIRPPESNDATSRANRVLQYGIKKIDLERIRTIPGLTKIVPVRDTEQRVVLRDTRFNVGAIATTPAIFGVINLKIARGDYFTWEHYHGSAMVCVLGAEAAKQIFPYEDPLGRTIQVGAPSTGSILVTVIGVLEPTGLRAGGDSQGIILRDLDLDVYFPLTLSETVFGTAIVRRQAGSFERKEIELSEIWLQAEGIEHVERLASVASNLLAVEHPGLRDGTVKAPIQILRNAEQLNRIFNIVLVGIAGISLVVGGIGIMNIMLASVTERTKEIGIRRALGAKQKHITLQFLIETTVISIAGGLIGIALGVGLATILPIAVEWFGGDRLPTRVAGWSVISSFVISAMIGILFGMYPAIRAAKLNPIEALRNE
ncbi:MAG TPA: ABC transporter permease [Tepidisphaeraceae bacterium]|nr:ABC transporter permease [Tepidisphaeraceae bacterium]